MHTFYFKRKLLGKNRLKWNNMNNNQSEILEMKNTLIEI